MIFSQKSEQKRRCTAFLCTFVGMNSEFVSRLEAWYGREGRVLPWRQTNDPYRIWVSEIILQQTRVAQGYDYFLRFVHQFPTVQALASATEDQVLRAWQGLGYYSRARNLHRAARMVADMDAFPSDYETIRALPGVGEYTAAAIASLAYGLPHAVLDGNVYRVLSRYLGEDTPIDTTAGHRTFAALAREMLDEDHPALYNQAIMDFGALVCLPRSPRCGECPLQETCMALHQGRVEQLPVKSRRTRVRDRYLTYVRIVCQDRVWLHRRGEGDIWQGLYEYYLMEEPQPLPAHVVASALPSGQLTLREQDIRHLLSHQRLHVNLYELHCPSLPAMDREGLWVPLAQADSYAMPRLLLDR